MLLALLMGNLGSDPDVRFTPSGQKVTNFSVASNSKRQGKDVTTWYKVVIFGDRLDKMISYLKKGSSVIINGELTLAKYTDKEGKEQTSPEIIADSLKFSPFGRTDRPAEQGAATQASGHGFQPGYNQSAETRSYAAPSYTPPQPQAYTPAPMHDFSFNEAPRDAHMQHQGHEEPPF